MTQQKIADELGTSKGGVNNILKKHNLTESLKSKMIDVEQVLKLHSEGYSNPDIAKLLDMRGQRFMILFLKMVLLEMLTKRLF